MKATLKSGVVLEGTPDEVLEAVSKLEGLHIGINGPAALAENAGEISSSSTVWTEQRVRATWDSLSSNQRRLMWLLLDKGKVTLDEVKKHLELSGDQIAGVLSCVNRNARRETGYDRARFFKRDKNEGQRYYTVPPDVLAFLQKIAKRHPRRA